ncbi:IRC20 [Symbiodinium microadriaticum]|nr:IRC20 [Symbiodinium microadriaticum]
MLLFCGLLTFASVAFGFGGRSLPSPWKELVYTGGFALAPIGLWLFALRLLPSNLRTARTVPMPRCEDRVWAQVTYALLQTAPLQFKKVKVSVGPDGSGCITVQAPAPSCNVSVSSSSSCSCCLADFTMESQLAVLRCGHYFCETCITEWSISGHAKSRFCPVCRADFGIEPA